MTANEFFRFHQSFKPLMPVFPFRKFWNGSACSLQQQTDPLLFFRYETKSKTGAGFFF